MMDDKVVCGFGYVGQATALAFNIKDHYSRTGATIGLDQVANKKFIFICLPTPTVEGKAFTDDIAKLIADINEYPDPNKRIFIIRSTVPPGFAEELMKRFEIDNVVSNPEFLSEDTWEKDAKNPWMIVIGGDVVYREYVVGLYKGRYKYAGPLETDNTTAELVKYALNTFFATKVIFANEIFDFAQKVGANYETVRIALENSPWGSKNHFKIFYKGKRGLHGSCLPKDTEAFATQTNSPLFKTVSELKYE